MKDRTVIVIAHRLTTIRNAHNINVILKGKLVESGTFNELVEKNGVFNQLVKLQLQ